MGILQISELNKRLIEHFFGSPANFRDAVDCLWNATDCQWQVVLKWKNERIPLCPTLPSYPNEAKAYALTARNCLSNLGHSNLSHYQSSFIKGFQIDGLEIKNPQALDLFIAAQLANVLSSGKYATFSEMTWKEINGCSWEFYISEPYGAYGNNH